MTIWLLAILLLGALAAIGYTQGAIRVGISFFGIILAALLSLPLAKLVKPAVVALGVSDLLLQWVLPPFIVFIVISAIVKVAAFAVHKKVDVYYKYKAGDLRLALWERLNARIGACLGLLNGLAYLVLISWVIFAFGYVSTQLGSSDTDPRTLRILNRMSRDLQSTGVAKVARAIDPLPAVFYEAADLAGLLYNNSLLEARLSRYPAFLTLAEKPEFQAIGQDKTFAEMRVRRAPIAEVLANPNIASIINNKDQLKAIWSIVEPDMKDLNDYLEAGTSKKYSDQILGRWFFDVNGAMVAYRKSKPNLPSKEMQKFRAFVASSYTKLSMVVMPDGNVVIKNLPQPRPGGGSESQNLQGKWKSAGSEYDFSLGTLGERHGKLEAGRLVLPGEGLALVFTPED